MSQDKTLYCSFCGKSQHEVTQLIAGPTVFICNECTVLCADLICKGMVEVGYDSDNLLSQAMWQLIGGNREFAGELSFLLKAHDKEIE